MPAITVPAAGGAPGAGGPGLDVTDSDGRGHGRPDPKTRGRLSGPRRFSFPVPGIGPGAATTGQPECAAPAAPAGSDSWGGGSAAGPRPDRGMAFGKGTESILRLLFFTAAASFIS